MGSYFQIKKFALFAVRKSLEENDNKLIDGVLWNIFLNQL